MRKEEEEEEEREAWKETNDVRGSVGRPPFFRYRLLLSRPEENSRHNDFVGTIYVQLSLTL